MELEENQIDEDLCCIKDSIVAEWLKKFESQSLAKNDFWEHWCTWVPKAYLPKEGTNYEPFIIQNVLDIVLIKSLEEFILGKEKVFLKSITEFSESSSVCGKIFSTGEILFHCYSCSVDPTCVLCLNCFKKSAHRNHSYKIGTSGGSGCCDCGDELSWKNDAHCENHPPPPEDESTEKKLPQDVISRARLVISSVLQYCYELTTLSRSPSQSPSVLSTVSSEIKPETGTFCTILYDDQIHSVQQVADLLAVLKSYSSEEVYTLTRYASEVGRLVLGYTPSKVSESFCLEAIKQLPLLSIHTVSWVHVSNQEFALHLLVWLEKFIKPSKDLRNVFTAVALNSDDESLSSCTVDDKVLSILEGILISDYILWRSAEVDWHNLILSGMLLDLDNKIAFSEKYLLHYRAISENNSKTQSNQSFICSLSVQVFTIPSIAYHLISKESALLILLKTFYKGYPMFCLNSMSQESLYSHFYDLCSILTDIGYLLGCPSEDWNQELRKAFVSAISFSLDVLTFMQSIYANFRGPSSEFSGHSIPELKLQSEFLTVLSSMLEWCSKDKIVLIKIFKMTLRALAPKYRKSVTTKSFAGHDAECPVYKSSHRSVSFLLPLSRFFSALYLHVLAYGLDYNTPDFNSLKKPTPRDILDPVLEIQVLISEDRAGILRNGFSLKNIITYYKVSKYRERTFDRDITLLQVCATLFESNAFLIHVLNQFDLLHWAGESFDPRLQNEETLKAIISKCEDFLFLLIILIGERHHPQIGKVTPIERFKHEMLHKLFYKPQTHSELVSSFERLCQKNPEIDLDKIITEIATFHKPNDDSNSGVYKVKKEYIHLYNVFFYHYSEDERAKSEEEQRKLRKQYHGIPCCTPPALNELNPQFVALSGLLVCDVMLSLIKTVLERGLEAKSETVSENCVRAALHLIGYALQEKQNNVYTDFVLADEKWGIKSILEQLANSRKASDHKDLIVWILDRYKGILNELNPTDVENKAESSKIADQVDEDEAAFHKKAAERKAAIMAQMSSLQAQFFKNYSSLLPEVEDEGMDFESSSSKDSPESIKKTCILCREDGVISLNGPAMILAAFIQESIVYPLNDANKSSLENLNQARAHINSCGHAMHFNCWQKFIQVEYKKVTQRGRTSKYGFDPAFHEYLCPLCKSLSNAVMPVISLNRQEDETSFDDWVKAIITPAGLKGTNDICKNCDITLKNSSSETTQNGNEIYCDCFNCEELFCSPSIQTNSNKEVSKIDTKWKEFVKGSLSDDMNSALESYVSSLALVGDASEDESGELFSTDNAYRVWTSLSFKIHSLELYLRYANKPLLGSLSSSQESCTSNLVSLAVFFGMFKNPFSHYIMKNNFKEMMGCIFKPHENEFKSILNCDTFHIFVCLTMSLHSYENKSFSRGIHFDRNIFRLILLLNFAQTLGALDLAKISSEEPAPNSSDETIFLAIILKLYNYRSEIHETLWNILKKESMPYLRCCALLYQFLNGVDPPEALQFQDGDSFENILQYLGCPIACKELLVIPEVFELFEKWSRVDLLKDPLLRSCLEPKVLMKLPEDYFQLIENAEKYQCPNCEKKGIKNQSLCLICGTIMCSEMICSRKEISGKVVGPCTYHSEGCARGTGLFLSLKSSCIVLLSARPKRGSLIPGPYIDTYGEADEGLFRGGPLTLCKEKFSNLQLSWISHNLPEMIFRRVDRMNESYVVDPWNVLLFL